MVPQGQEGLLGTIARRTESVGAKANPGQKGNEGEPMKNVGVANIAGWPDYQIGYRAPITVTVFALWRVILLLR